MARLLIADDDAVLCDLLQQYFEMDHIQLDIVHRGDEALQALRQARYDLLILDIMLPGMNGLDVLRELRRTGTTPVLMLSARGDEMDRIVGLELGADDYLPKPCSPRELAARARSILRRSAVHASAPPPLKVGDVELHPGSRQVACKGQFVELTGAEFSILHELMKTPGCVIEKSQLSQNALGRRLQSFDRSLDTHVSNLRRKLGPGPDGQARISAVRGAGYVYIVPAQS